MEERIQKYIGKILQLDRQGETPGVGGMGAYDPRRFEIQRNYYKSLPPKEKRNYEEAVIALCGVREVDQSRLGLYLCSELADLFPPEWKGRVVALVQTLVSNGLPPALFGTVSFDVLNLITEFHIRSLTPLVREYFHGITDAFKSDQIQRVEWITLFHAISKGLITNSPEGFWEEFRLFFQDRDLLDRLGENLFEQIYFWVSEGKRIYGLEWMRQFAVEYSRIPDPAVKKSVRDWMVIGIESRARLMAKTENDEEYTEFLKWLRETLRD